MMKRVISVILLLALCLGLCACKSGAVKEVEAQIDALTAESSYSDIYSVYQLYCDLSAKEQQKVENISTFHDYCSDNGTFVLTEEMLERIEYEFEREAVGGVSGVQFSLMYDLSIMHNTKGWAKHGNVEIASHKRSDPYTYSVYGTLTVTDDYGQTTKKKFTMTYQAEYTSEKEEGYQITHITTVD